MLSGRTRCAMLSSSRLDHARSLAAHSCAVRQKASCLGACTVKGKRLYLEYAPFRFRANFAQSWTRNMSHLQYGVLWHGRLRVKEIFVTCLDDTKNINHMIGVFELVRAGFQKHHTATCGMMLYGTHYWPFIASRAIPYYSGTYCPVYGTILYHITHWHIIL